MKNKKLTGSGVEVSPIVFGAWAIGEHAWGGTDRANAIEAIREAYARGFTSIGVVGEAIRDIPRDRIQIFTKCGQIWEEKKGVLVHTRDYGGKQMHLYRYAGKESVIRECEESLRRLGTNYIDLYSLHFRDLITPVEETMEAFIRLKEQGKIRAAGLCNHTQAEMAHAGSVVDIEANKVCYSMLDRLIEEDLVPYCVENKKAIMAYRVLQRGLLTGWDLPKFLSQTGEPSRDVAMYEPENMERIRSFLDKLKSIAADYGASVTQLCIRWAIDRPGITSVLLGATSAEQIAYDAKAMEIDISGSDTAAINGLIAELDTQLELEPKANA